MGDGGRAGAAHGGSHGGGASHGDDAQGADGAAVMRACSLCGRPAPGQGDSTVGPGPGDAAALSMWTTEADPRRGPVLICPDCTREHLRSIEARLDQEWW